MIIMDDYYNSTSEIKITSIPVDTRLLIEREMYGLSEIIVKEWSSSGYVKVHDCITDTDYWFKPDNTKVIDILPKQQMMNKKFISTLRKDK